MGKKENGTLFSHNESKIMPSGGKWMQPEIIILSELSQTNVAHFFLTWRTEMAAGCLPSLFSVLGGGVRALTAPEVHYLS